MKKLPAKRARSADSSVAALPPTPASGGEGGQAAAEPQAPKIRPWKVKAAEPEHPSSVIVQFQATSGETTGPQIEVPFETTREQLEQILNSVLGSGEERKPYSFFVSEAEIVDSLGSIILAQVRARRAPRSCSPHLLVNVCGARVSPSPAGCVD